MIPQKQRIGRVPRQGQEGACGTTGRGTAGELPCGLRSGNNGLTLTLTPTLVFVLLSGTKPEQI